MHHRTRALSFAVLVALMAGAFLALAYLSGTLWAVTR